MATRTPEETFDAFVNGTLSHGEWTHEAHLITCVMALRDRSAGETIDYLREAIQTHNCGIGIQNTAAGGYHETLTRYYVVAVDKALQVEATLDYVMADERCGRKAALEFWTKDVLFSPAARLDWHEPDRAPLPWLDVPWAIA